MIHSFRAWKQRRRQLRQQRRLADPNTYPTDMNRDAVETMVSVRDYSMTSTERLNGLCEAVRYISNCGIAGDIVECGVWRGGSMMAIAQMLVRAGDTDRQLHLYDTFTGMPTPTAADVCVNGQTAMQDYVIESNDRDEFTWCIASLPDVQAHMAQVAYPRDRVHYHVGKVEDTIPAAVPDKIALLRLDTDWYTSTAHELEHLFPRLVDGGVLIIDDYGHWEGARRAVDEYFQSHRIGMMLHRLDYTGRIGINHASVSLQMANVDHREAA
jgi:O-methyltransferase